MSYKPPKKKIEKYKQLLHDKYEQKPFIADPDEFDGTYVGAGSFETTVENNYDIRAFLKYKQATGTEWKDLSDSDKSKFFLSRSRRTECRRMQTDDD